MGWTVEGEGVKEQLMRIVALLLGLGALAERACRAPLAVRVSAMGFLLPAEQVARAFLTGEAASPGPAAAHDDPAAAMRLAAQFRALAVALAALAARLPGCGHVAADVVARPAGPAGDRAGPDQATPPPFDTS